MNTLWHDIRYASRRLLRSPGFTMVALLTLMLGIGANSAIFSVINSVLLRPLPYAEPDRIVTLWGRFPRLHTDHMPASEPEILDYQRSIKSFSHLGAYVDRNLILSGQNDPEMVSGTYATAGLFQVLGATAELGRPYTPEEDVPGASVVVLSHACWQRRFASDPTVIGKPMIINDKRYVVVGVMKPGFQFPSDKTEMWLPLAIDFSNMGNRGEHYLNVVAKLAPNAGLHQAQAELDALSRSFESQYPGFYIPNSNWRLVVTPLQQEVVGSVRPALLALLGAVGFVLLISCANVTNLLLVRAQSQEKEIAVRTALGASRGRLVRQLFTESLVLSFAGGCLGLIFGSWILQVFVASQAQNLPRYQEIHIDGWVLAFTLLVTLLTAVLVGLVPAFRSSGFDVNETLKQAGGRSQAMGRHQTRNLLVVSEMAAALILLIGAGLLIGAFYNLSRIDPGFRTDDVITMRVTLPRTRYAEPFQSAAFFQQLATRVEGLPGVKTAGLVSQLPFGTDSRDETFFIEGRTHDTEGPATSTNTREVSRGYFQTLRIPLVKGRVFGSQDNAQSPKVVIIDETMARRFWPDEDPVGKRLALIGEMMSIGPYMTIVGVVGDIKDGELQAEAQPHLYIPYQQRPSRSMYVALHMANDRYDAAVKAVRSEVHTLDRGVPVYEIEPLEGRLSQSVSNQRLMALLLTVFATLAVLLAAIGLYGVMSYSVLQRTHEIGIRVALGAGRGDVLTMVLRQGLVLVLIGLALGVLGAFALARVLASQIYGLSASGPLIFLGAPLLLVLVALIASYVPARRTTRVDPVIALRYE